ncbi:alpha/beta hydrolase [Robertkochia aurantiaca]|uniref:alpha/beta hydrolase n=1 Tax=Robertkochia aurantiaca TaxID=2873700 RepID=UPI001CCBCC37|nr:alpha/beta fold hydrolase [Robertkochia sp. 3YJGBD-33]
MNRFLLFAAFIAVQVSFSQMDDRFYFPNKDWKSTDGYRFEEIFFYPDQDTLSTVLMKPDTSPKASILYFHGSGGNVTNYMPLAQPLVEAGYQVLMVDFRGYGHSTGKPTHVNIGSDAQFLYEKMQELPAVRGQEILVYGSSMGTQAAIHLARYNQEKLKGLVLDGALASFTDIALQYAPPAAHPDIKAQESLFPYSAKADIAHITDLPILFIHSKEDKEVSYEQGERLFELTRAPKSFWTYEGGHLQAPALFPEELTRRVDALTQ